MSIFHHSHKKKEAVSEFTVNITNNFVHDIFVYKENISPKFEFYNLLSTTNTAMTNAIQSMNNFFTYGKKSGAKVSISCKESNSVIVEVPAIGSILIQVLGTTPINGFEDAVPKVIEVTEGGKKTMACSSYKYGALIKYANRELYCKSDNLSMEINLTINQFGTLSIDKSDENCAYGEIALKEFAINKK